MSAEVAAAGPTVSVPDAHGTSLRLVEEPSRPTQVQRHAVAVEHDGDQVRGAGQPHRLGRRDHVTGAQLGRTQPGTEPVVVEGHHQRGGTPPCRGSTCAGSAPRAAHRTRAGAAPHGEPGARCPGRCGPAPGPDVLDAVQRRAELFGTPDQRVIETECRILHDPKISITTDIFARSFEACGGPCRRADLCTESGPQGPTGNAGPVPIRRNGPGRPTLGVTRDPLRDLARIVPGRNG